MKNISIVIVILCFALLSCKDNIDFAQVYDTTPQNNWNKAIKYDFIFENADTLAPRDIFFQIRTNNHYPWSNLFLIAEIENPLGQVTKDTLEYEIIDPSGKALGSGIADIKENILLYKSNYRLNATGKYKISVKHSMRNVKLQGICSVGIKIENKSKN